MKTVFDLLLAMITLLLLSPIFIIVIFIIILDDPGNPFFIQKRIGLRGRTFNMYKFRSMKLNSSETGPYYTKVNDPRITKVGRVIRRTSIDELPQIFNVLMGHMSIVGPRPDVPIQENNYTQKQWNMRNSVKPGITGLAQATIRSNASPVERTKLDLEYVNKKSFLFDMKIILMTIKQIIKKGGN